MSSLFDLREEFKALYELAIAEGAEEEQAFLDTMEALKGELGIKAGGYVHVIKTLEMEANECDNVLNAFKRKKETRVNSIKRMKEALIEAMDAAGVEQLPAGEYTLEIAKNGGLQPLKIDGEVPDNFTKIKIEPDNDLIRKALNDGEELEFAHLEPRGRHLNIK